LGPHKTYIKIYSQRRKKKTEEREERRNNTESSGEEEEPTFGQQPPAKPPPAPLSAPLPKLIVAGNSSPVHLLACRKLISWLLCRGTVTG